MFGIIGSSSLEEIRHVIQINVETVFIVSTAGVMLHILGII